MDAPARSTVLVVDDEKNIRESIKIVLAADGVDVLSAHDAVSAWRALQETIVDALIVDIRLGAVDGLSFFKSLQADGLSIPTIFISGQATLTEAAQAVRIGAFDFIEKPFTSEKLAIVVKRCLEHATLTKRVRMMESQLATTEIIGDSPSIRQVLADAMKVAPTNANVLIQGESGTGKELLANMIHTHSRRREQPVIKVNCSAVPENLVESELFGYEKGSFSGAALSKKGFFEMAHRGTLFLDEVADLSLAAQAKILRALQNGEIQKIGSGKALKTDVRVICATHKDLRHCVSAGQFREDLYYRLNVVPITLPALRERPDDIPVIVSVLVRRLCERNNLRDKVIDDEVLSRLKEYSWPGNVRELQNVLERMLILSEERITIDDIPRDLVRDPGEAEIEERLSLSLFRKNAEREFILSAMKRHNGNITRAAAELGVRRTYLHRRIKALNIGKNLW